MINDYNLGAYDAVTFAQSYEMDIELNDGLRIQQRFPQMMTDWIWGAPTRVTERKMDISSVSASRGHLEFRDKWSATSESALIQGPAVHMTSTTDYTLDIKTPEEATGTWKMAGKSIANFAITSYCSQGVLELHKIPD